MDLVIDIHLLEMVEGLKLTSKHSYISPMIFMQFHLNQGKIKITNRYVDNYCMDLPKEDVHKESRSERE